jgi:hypothetical protein
MAFSFPFAPEHAVDLLFFNFSKVKALVSDFGLQFLVILQPLFIQLPLFDRLQNKTARLRVWVQSLNLQPSANVSMSEKPRCKSASAAPSSRIPGYR